VIFGCFILFGASSIAAGIVHVFADADTLPAAVPASTPPAMSVYAEPSVTKSPVKAPPYDPYAGAALPTRP
jgi:hypothetical protein